MKKGGVPVGKGKRARESKDPKKEKPPALKRSGVARLTPGSSRPANYITQWLVALLRRQGKIQWHSV